MNDTITATLDKGLPALPLRPYPTRTGGTGFAVLGTRKDNTRYFAPKGVFVARSAFSKLPTTVEVLGQKITLKKDTTDKGKDRVSGSATVTVPGHGEKVFDFRMTVTDDTRVNIHASIHGVGGQTLDVDAL